MIRFDRLETLATFLDTLPKEKFTYGGFWCGTAGCALGWCPVVFKEHWRLRAGVEPVFIGDPKSNSFSSAELFFGITNSQHLFMPEMQNTAKYGGKKLGNRATPSEVAHNIREFIKVMGGEKPKREKIKVQITPDLITPPIPKEVEKIDRPDEVIPLEEAAKDFQESLNDYSKALHSTIDFLMESAYQGYKKARTGNHFLTPEFYEGIYKREDIEKFEARLKMEKSI